MRFLIGDLLVQLKDLDGGLYELDGQEDLREVYIRAMRLENVDLSYLKFLALCLQMQWILRLVQARICLLITSSSGGAVVMRTINCIIIIY